MKNLNCLGHLWVTLCASSVLPASLWYSDPLFPHLGRGMLGFWGGPFGWGNVRVLRVLSDSTIAPPPQTPASSPLRLCQHQPPRATWGPKQADSGAGCFSPSILSPLLAQGFNRQPLQRRFSIINAQKKVPFSCFRRAFPLWVRETASSPARCGRL